MCLKSWKIRIFFTLLNIGKAQNVFENDYESYDFSNFDKEYGFDDTYGDFQVNWKTFCLKFLKKYSLGR